MLRFGVFVLLAAPPLLEQTGSAHSRIPPPLSEDKWLNQVDALESRARQILKSELSRKLNPKCDNDQLSMAEEGQCLSADQAITDRNYRAFARAIKAALAIQPPEIDPTIFPPASKNFAAAESAWITYVDKTCAALGDTYEGGSGSPMAMTGCQQQLTRQHMKDLNEIFLKPYEVHR